jgi:hypothetical protein
MNKLYKVLRQILTAISFIMLFPAMGVIVYYLLVCYDISRVIAGAITLYICVFLNKSL